MSGGADILLRADDCGIATLTLNRPEARNALNGALLEALRREIVAIAGDRSVRVVVIGGNGPAFCAGHDLKELRAQPDEAAQRALFARCSAMMQGLLRLDQPVVAKVHGIATAGGCQLVATCDLAVAAETARFATPGVDIGLFCTTPGVALARAVARKAALDMLLTARPVDAATALRIGLVSQVVPDAELDRAAAALAATLASKSPATLALGKQAFYRQLDLPLAEAYDFASGVMARNVMGADAAEGIDAFLEKRKPVWRAR